jgi:hypothetical protein
LSFAARAETDGRKEEEDSAGNGVADRDPVARVARASTMAAAASTSG